jgi:DNA-binding IscR family transcriptional regulator
LQIDRIDNNSGYSPDNCRFTNVSENCRNRRSTILNASIVEQMRSDYASGSYKKIEIAKKYNISPSHTHRVLTGISW